MTDAASWHDSHASVFADRYTLSAAFRERERIWRTWIERFATPVSAVLDAGCGPGVLSALAARHAGSVLGIDPSPAMLAIARERAGTTLNLRFREARIGDEAALDGARFDLVLCSSVLEYLPDWEAGLSFLGRSLRPGGTLLFSLPNLRSAYRWAETVRFHTTGRPAYRAMSRHAPGLARIEQALRRERLEPIATTTFGVVPVLSHIARPLGLASVTDTLRLVACRRPA
ncbi:MAG: hypothetical protein DI629_07800 [Mesorhizobium amorphae]|nr:MAG: hypothetical protein DI629_07800 [Mesorhizobium amorphae]